MRRLCGVVLWCGVLLRLAPLCPESNAAEVIGMGSVVYGDNIRDSITAPDAIHAYTFDGNAGDVVEVRALDEHNQLYYDFDIALDLYGPQGQLIASDTTAGPYTWAVLDMIGPLPETGQYTVFVYDFGGNSTGQYGLSVQRTFNPGNAAHLPYGATVHDTVTWLAELHAYTFDGNAGDVVEVRALDEHNQLYYDFDIALDLYGPQGQLIASDTTAGPYDSARVTPTTLPATGRYTIFVYDFGGNSMAAYGMKLWCPFYCYDLRGNVDGVFCDRVNVADLTYLIAHLFRSGTAPPCGEEADVNADGALKVSDVTLLIAYLFRGGPPPAPC